MFYCMFYFTCDRSLICDILLSVSLNGLHLDVAVGAFISDAVLILRTRPIHSVSAGIEFDRPVIEWYHANCPELVTKALSSAAGDNAFCLQLTIVFSYSSPPEDPSQHGDYYLRNRR